MKKFIIVFALSIFFAAIDAISQSHESSNIIYITNTIERPIYIESLILKTNIIEKLTNGDTSEERRFALFASFLFFLMIASQLLYFTETAQKFSTRQYQKQISKIGNK